MFSFFAAILMMSGAAEPLTIEFSMYGAPSSAESSLRVTCAERIYSFSFSTSGGERTIEFDREPVAPTAELSSDVIGVLNKFVGIPFVDAWCSGPNELHPSGQLLLEIHGWSYESDAAAREDCNKRSGAYDPKSSQSIIIDGDTMHVFSDKIGKCTTRESIDKLIRLQRGKSK